jgi:dTDP-4-amino-4,6-dideoxygalactose transaminase
MASKTLEHLQERPHKCGGGESPPPTTPSDQSIEFMKVPLLDLQAQYVSLQHNVRAAIARVFDSQQFVLGPEVAALEKELAAYCGTTEAVGCASGSDALLLALMALDIGPGDEVITTPFTFFATGSAITRLAARPVFVDIDPVTYNIDAAGIEAAITSRTKTIMPVHLYGQCADMDAVLSVAREKNVPVIEDAAQAIGAEDNGRRAGSMGLAGCFSFYPTKNLGGAGDGGLLTTNNGDFASRLKRLRTHGGFTEYEHEEVGVNSRLDALQAAVLRVKLPHLDEWSNTRAQRAAIYSELLEQADVRFDLKTPVVRPNNRHIFHQYVVRVPQRRDALSDHLKSHDIGTKVYYPIPLHLQQCFRFLGYKPGDFPEAERAALETMALPMFPEITDAQQEYVVNTIKNFKP